MYTVSMYPCMWYMSLHCHCPPNEWSSSTMPTMHLQEEVGHYETYRENHLMLWLFMFSSRQNHVKRPSQWKKRNCTWKKRPSFQRLRFRSFRGKIKAPVDSGSVASRLELVKMKLSWYEFSNTAGVGSIKHMNCLFVYFFRLFWKFVPFWENFSRAHLVWSNTCSTLTLFTGWKGDDVIRDDQSDVHLALKSYKNSGEIRRFQHWRGTRMNSTVLPPQLVVLSAGWTHSQLGSESAMITDPHGLVGWFLNIKYICSRNFQYLWGWSIFILNKMEW